MIAWLRGWLADLWTAVLDMVPIAGWTDEDFESAVRKVRAHAAPHEFNHRELQVLRDCGLDPWQTR